MTGKGAGLPGAVLFDLDGLLVDSEGLWTLAEIELGHRLGVDFTPALKAQMIGRRLDEAMTMLLAHAHREVTEDALAQVSEWLLERMVTLFAAGVPVRPGASALVRSLARHGVPMAVVTSSYRVLLDAALPALPGGADTFAATLAGDEVSRAKPDPEPYRTAAALLGVSPSITIVCEDSRAGALSAVAAGCACLVVPGPVPVEPDPRWALRKSLTQVDPQLLGRLATAP